MVTAGPKIKAARAAAEQLEALGQFASAEAVRSLCRSNAGLRETCSRLMLDDTALRDRVRQAESEASR